MRERTKRMTGAALMCAVLIVSTLWLKFTIPGSGVLFTTQVLFVLLCGQILSPLDCLCAVGSYLALGLIGLPVFSATSGLGVLLTPSFGYLLSFPVAAATVSALQKRLAGFAWGHYGASLAGLLLIYAIALPYVAALQALYFHTPIPFSALLSGYFLAFLPLDLVKSLMAAFLGAKIAKAKI